MGLFSGIFGGGKKKSSPYIRMARQNRDNWKRQEHYYKRSKRKFKAEAKKNGGPSGFFRFF